MNRKIVGMISSYSGLENRPDWLWHQTPYHFGNWGNIQILAQAPKPDFLLMYNYTSFPEISDKKGFFWQKNRKKNEYELAQQELVSKLRGVPKERIIYLLREPPLDEVVEANKRFYRQAQNYCSYISGPDDFAPTPDYMPAIWYHSNSFRDLNDLPHPEKVAPCSWITSGITRTANHRQRMTFLQELQASNIKFDLYGRDLPNWARTPGQIGSKWSGMAPYYYNLAIENYADNDWYVSEKLWDALLAWCLPIYYGGSAADKLLPSGSFLRLPSLDEKGIAYIQDVTATPDAWYAAKDAIAEARKVILHKLNLLDWLSNYVKQFD
ncbi:MAG: glycosyltransferase family 10 [Nostocaceae cyanobacterium]|nr:glycosyltransferase family 10 [Nostocaceae cyanobacterium]